MKKFANEQDSASKPPEPQGERTPKETERQALERDSGELLLDETIDEIREEDEPEELVEWDGSEAELVADEDAAEYEEQNTGIQIRYTLKQREIFPVLLKAQYTQRRLASSLAAGLLALVLAVVSFVQSASGRGEFALLGVVCLVVLLLVLPMPVLKIRREARAAADGREIRMAVYPDHIEMGEGDSGWEIPLDGTVERRVMRELMVLYIDGGNLVILPLRCVEPAVLPEVQAMLFAGTRPEK